MEKEVAAAIHAGELDAILASIREDLTHTEKSGQDFENFQDFKSWWETIHHYDIQDADMTGKEMVSLEGQLQAAFEVLFEPRGHLFGGR